MPHTSRKKKNQQEKRRQIEGSDGWTHVFKAPKRTDFRLELELFKDAYNPTDVPTGMTLTKLQDQVADYADRWRQSPCGKDTGEILQSTVLKLESLNVTNCVCLGLGSFTASRVSGARFHENSLCQLAAFETWIEILSTGLQDDKQLLNQPD